MVISLLQLEWLKVKPYRPFWILIGMYVTTLPMIAYVIDKMQFPKEMGNPLMFPHVWNWMGYIGNWLVLFGVGFWSVLTVTNEYSDRTLRQNIISGLSRRDFFLSKLSLIVSMSIFTSLYYALVTIIVGFVNTETVFASRVTEGVGHTLMFFLMSMTYASIGFLCGMWLRRSGLALFVYFSYIMFIELIIRFLIVGKIYSPFNLYFPAKAANDLQPNPLMRWGMRIAEGSSNFRYYMDSNEAIITASVYLVLLFFTAYYLLSKRDL
jgi:ABC-2 type transport system permease protein